MIGMRQDMNSYLQIALFDLAMLLDIPEDQVSLASVTTAICNLQGEIETLKIRVESAQNKMESDGAFLGMLAESRELAEIEHEKKIRALNEQVERLTKDCEFLRGELAQADGVIKLMNSQKDPATDQPWLPPF